MSIAIQQYNALYASQPTLDPGVGAADDGRADRHLPVRPARVHARRRRHRGGQVTDVAETRRPGDRRARLRIPSVAWSRPIGLRVRPASARPRVPGLIDDGEWAGVPIGGLGSGSIGRTFRGDVSRWHLEVGRHAFRAGRRRRVLGVRRAARTAREAHVLSALRPGGELPAWGLDLPVGAGTYHALFPRAWQTFEPAALGGVRLTGEQLSPVIARDYERSALPGRARTSGGSRTRAPTPRTVGLLLSWANPLGARPTESPVAGAAPGGRPRRARAWPSCSATAANGPAGLRGTFAIAAARGRRWSPWAHARGSMPGRRPRPVGGLRRRRAARPAATTTRTAGRRSPASRSAGARRRDGRRSSPARRARSGSRSPGTCRSSSSAAGGAGGSATRGPGAGPAAGRWTSRATRWPRRRPGGPRSRRGSGR